MGITLISPHRDDAAFSCGILISLCAAIGVEIQVVNVFTQSGYAPFAALSNVDEISGLRKEEDARLQGLVGSCLRFRDLGLWDAPLRLRIAPEETLIDPLAPSAYLMEVANLERVLRPVLAGADCVLLPLAIGGHIDHRIVRDAGMGCVPREALAFYEDLPYAASGDPAERGRAVADLDPSSALQPVLVRRPNGADVKREFASCYPSQIAASTVAEMAAYAESCGGGENLYAGKEAARLLTQVVQKASSRNR